MGSVERLGAGKAILGLVLLLVGLGLFVDSVYPLTGSASLLPISWLMNFIIILTGVIPIFLILVRSEERREGKSVYVEV